MQRRIKTGLIVGALGFLLSFFVSGFVGLCQPATPFLVGAVAGFFATQNEKTDSKWNGARVGSSAGVIAGVLAANGPIIGRISAMFIIRNFQIGNGFYAITDSSNTTEVIVFYLIGLVQAGFFGWLCGGVSGYLSTSNQLAESTSPESPV